LAGGFSLVASAPTPPYDHAGWTLAFQMGVEFDRILDGFTGPFEPVTDWNLKPAAGKVTSVNGAAGYLLSHRMVDSFVALNQLLKANEEVYWLPDGTWYVAARPSTRAALDKIAIDLGVGANTRSYGNSNCSSSHRVQPEGIEPP